MPKRLLRVAHRGASREYRENTLPAFARALAIGADAIELDVHTTRDGVVVVHHDSDLPAGPAEQRLPIASSGIDDVHRATRGIVDVPTLADVLDLVAGRAELLIELKGAGVERAVLDCMRGYEGPYALHSFDHAAIERVASAAPTIPRGLLYDAAPLHLIADLARSGASDVWPRYDLATPTLIAEAHRAGARVIAWTVNDPNVAQRLIDEGVDAVCTDDLRILHDL